MPVRTCNARAALFSSAQRGFSLSQGLQGKVARMPHQSKGSDGTVCAAEAHGIKHTIVFEDHGQDFLEWDVIDGVVVDCRPFQGFVWKGTKVDRTKAAEGQLLPIITKRGERRVVMYPVIAMSRTERPCRNP